MDEEIKLSPTQDLILEVLAARKRLGETHWSFDNRVMKQAQVLADKGLIKINTSGPVPHTFRASLTEDGASYAMDPNYEIPSARFNDPDRAIRKAAHALTYQEDPIQYVAGLLRNNQSCWHLLSRFMSRSIAYRNLAQKAIKAYEVALPRLKVDAAVEGIVAVVDLQDALAAIDNE